MRKANNLVMKSGNLIFVEHSGPLQACNGTAYIYIYIFIYLFINLCVCVCMRAGQHGLASLKTLSLVEIPSTFLCYFDGIPLPLHYKFQNMVSRLLRCTVPICL